MKCPYCNNDMVKGYLKSSRRLFWGREDALDPLEENEVKLSKGFAKALKGFFVGFAAESYYCRHCKKIITSVE